jgi:hypothetical protein
MKDMLLKNDSVALEVEESGRGLKMTDLKRGTVWVLDESSIMWNGCIMRNDYPTQDGMASMKTMWPVTASETANALQITYDAGGCPVTYSYHLLDDGVEVHLAPPDSLEIEALSMPGSFFPENEPMKLLLPIMQGMLWDGKGDYQSRMCRSGSHMGFSMQMFGALGRTGGLMAAADTAIDSVWWYQKDERGFRVQNVQDSSLGSMRYERVIRFLFTDAGIVPIAKRYRTLVKERGRFVTWEEKIAERPGLERLFGSLMCYIGYCQDDLDYVAEFEKLKKYGFDRVLAYPVDFSMYEKDFLMGGLPPIHLTRKEIAKITDMGFDVCPWTWINEAMDDHTAKRASMYRITRDGERVFGWQIDDYKWYKVCSPEMDAFEAKAVVEGADHMTWDHFDVLTCASSGECHALDHKAHLGRPMSREEDLRWLRKTLVTGQGLDHRRNAVSSESFNDLFSLEYDLGSVKAWPQYGPWTFWPIPLTSLVFHDSMIHSWWEPHNYNTPQGGRSEGPNLLEYGGGRPDLQAACDALLGCPPDVFPFGTQYAWTGHGSETFTFSFRFEDPMVQYALAKAKPVADLHRKIGKLEMTNFEILSDDGWVQRSIFSDGTTVIANFSSRMRSDIPGIDPIQGQSWVAM